MKRREHYSVEEIKALLDVGLKIEGDILKRIITEALDQIATILFGEQPRESSENKIIDSSALAPLPISASLIIARKLKLNERNMPLLSQEDVNSAAEEMFLKVASKKEGDSKEKKLVEKTIKQIMNNVVNLLLEPSDNEGDKAYEKQWQKIDAILTVARVTKTKFTELPNIPELRRQVLRLTCKNRRQHRLNILKIVNKLTNPEDIKQALFIPLLEGAASEEKLTVDKLESIKEDFEEDFMPQISESCAKTKENLCAMVEEEVNRIWN